MRSESAFCPLCMGLAGVTSHEQISSPEGDAEPYICMVRAKCSSRFDGSVKSNRILIFLVSDDEFFVIFNELLVEFSFILLFMLVFARELVSGECIFLVQSPSQAGLNVQEMRPKRESCSSSC